MIKEFELFGEWFLSTKQDKREVGTLLYRPFEGITLKIYGDFGDDIGIPSDDDVDIICGVTSDGKQITLLNCSVTSRGCNTSIMGEKAVVQSAVTYTVLYILKGVHILEEDNMIFSKISAEIFNLREWVNQRGFQEKDEYDPNDKNRVIEHTVSCKLPEIIEFEITEDIIGKFVPMMGGSSSRYQTTITQKLLFQIQSTQKQTIGDLLQYIGTLADLLDLALYRRTHYLSITLDENIELYFPMKQIKVEQTEKLASFMLFSYCDLGDNPCRLIKNWYEKCEILAPAINLLLESFTGQYAIENRFLNLAQAAETFHARINPSNKPPKLCHRLTEIVDKYNNSILDRILGTKSQFVSDIVDSRNYYTHYPIRLANKASKGADLFYLSEKLKILLVCSFLMEIGITKETLETKMERLKHTLFPHLADWKEIV